MSTERNKAAIEQARQHWNTGNLEGYLQTLYAPTAVLHGYIGVEPGLESIRQFYQGFLAAFPGCQLIFDDLFAVEDRLACRFVLQGTHGGPFQGLPATGKPIHIPGITILRFVDGKCVERWSQSDFFGLMQQLGMLPTPG